MAKYFIVKRDFAVLGIIILLATGLYFYLSRADIQGIQKPRDGAAAGIAIQSDTTQQEILFTPDSRIMNADTCAGLVSATKISCKDAMARAAGMYHGNIFGVIKLESAWAIGIELHRAISIGGSNRTKIEVDVDFASGELIVK